MQQPVLSIGIIFKNEIRSLERCLKALQPLRDAIPCELVMADTGSNDGSREIAGRYADILFDFPWINDFSAARNAVMDRCSGVWHLAVDSDEYLDGDITQLLDFLRRDGKKRDKVSDLAYVTQRNYSTYDMNGPYTDFLARRMVRLSVGYRYTGAIHESLENKDREPLDETLVRTVLHHDGYVGLNEETGREKRERNIRLLRQELEKDPDDLRTLMQFIESGMTEPDLRDKARHSVDLVLEGRFRGQTMFEPIVLRDAIKAANKANFPETDEWIQKAEELFPQSVFTLVDVNYIAALRCINQKDHKGTISRGERYLKALRDSRSGTLDPTARLYGVLACDSHQAEQDICYCLANAYALENMNAPRALELLEGLDYSCLNMKDMVSAIQALRNLHFSTLIDTTQAVMTMWNGVTEPKPSAEKAEARKKAMLDACTALFSEHFRTVEVEDEGYCRPSYTMLLPLRKFCDLGKAAAVMESKAPAEMERLLCEIEDWTGIPGEVLHRALDRGVPFPPSGHPLNVEEMDVLAVGLTRKGVDYVPLALRTAEQANAENWQGFVWAHELMLAAVRVWPWEHPEKDEDQGLKLARAFAKLEREFLPRCYTPEALGEDRLFALPPLHRFGWHLIRAFDALDAGDAVSYARLLRESLTANEGVKDMVGYLVEQTPELKIQPKPSDELRVLADQIRTVLANFAPDDPAVAALKQSEAYQKVAHLIEGSEPPVAGGLLQ